MDIVTGRRKLLERGVTHMEQLEFRVRPLSNFSFVPTHGRFQAIFQFQELAGVARETVSTSRQGLATAGLRVERAPFRVKNPLDATGEDGNAAGEDGA